MALIDNKGRLFGKINLIDLSVLLLVLAAVASISANLIITPCGKNAKRSEGNKADERMSVEVLEVRVIFTNIIKELMQDPNFLAPGSTVFNGNATIVKVLKVNDLIKKEKNLERCDVTVLMRIKCVNLLGDYYCNNVPIKINSPLAISNSYYSLSTGIIVGMRVLGNE